MTMGNTVLQGSCQEPSRLFPGWYTDSSTLIIAMGVTDEMLGFMHQLFDPGPTWSCSCAPKGTVVVLLYPWSWVHQALRPAGQGVDAYRAALYIQEPIVLLKEMKTSGTFVSERSQG